MNVPRILIKKTFECGCYYKGLSEVADEAGLGTAANEEHTVSVNVQSKEEKHSVRTEAAAAISVIYHNGEPF